MCGIVGYIGHRNSVPILFKGLRRLEYRGYDSAGVTVLSGGRLVGKKMAGKIADLEHSWDSIGSDAFVGIGHTRWATHGIPNDVNAHPHYDCNKRIAIVHNGVIENYSSLRQKLETVGHHFDSDTDTEVIAHLIEEYHKTVEDLEHAVRSAMSQLEGSFAVVVISEFEPDKLIAARRGSPLAIGYGNGEYIVASDAPAIIEHTRRIVFFEDGEMAVVSNDGVCFKTFNGILLNKDGVEELTLDVGAIEKGSFTHYMLKEIFEQPETIQKALCNRLNDDEGTADLAELHDVIDRVAEAPRLIFAACGTSWHAALIGKYMLEQYVRKPIAVEYASEFRYSDPLIGYRDVVILISQSGETADTLAALREAKRKHALTISICNAVGSSIARESDVVMHLNAGPEIGVASTKAFTSQIVVLALLTLALARRNGMSKEQGREFVRALQQLPENVRTILEQNEMLKQLARQFRYCQNFLYLGRGYNFPVALEGALKLKEISYIHAEGYPAAEMKHGPIALIDEQMPILFVAPKDATYEKILNNIEEVKARRGTVITVVNEQDNRITALADHIVTVPRTADCLTPILTVVPLQLLAYHVAVLKGYDVDQPRNLAKSVTVE